MMVENKAFVKRRLGRNRGKEGKHRGKEIQ